MGRVGRYFQHNSLWWIKKNSTQSNLLQESNPTHGDQVGPMGWTYFLITIINIKLRIRIIPPQIKTIYNQII